MWYLEISKLSIMGLKIGGEGGGLLKDFRHRVGMKSCLV